jgi:hypothetical protein
MDRKLFELGLASIHSRVEFILAENGGLCEFDIGNAALARRE